MLPTVLNLEFMMTGKLPAGVQLWMEHERLPRGRTWRDLERV